MKNQADENVELVRRGYKAFNEGDMKTLSELFDENAVWHSPGRTSLAGEYKGKENIFAQFGRYGGGTGGTFKAKLLHVLKDDNGHVVGIHHNSAERNGKKLDFMGSILFEIKDGKVIDGREFGYDLYAWEEFWS